jgi:hypothetical protein
VKLVGLSIGTNGFVLLIKPVVLIICVAIAEMTGQEDRMVFQIYQVILPG